jgi:hypothetical protein
MHIDSSRSRFDPAKHYSGVLALQGRVTLDSDQTEQQSILLHHLRTAVADIVGPAGVPSAAPGFAIDRTTTDKLADLSVSAGRMYVDGILVENAADTTYWGQSDGHLDQDLDQLPSESAYVAFLRVWEREVTAVQDPDLLEVALGIHGPDTTARAQVVWQVATLALDGGDPSKEDALEAWRAWLDNRPRRGSMQAAARRPDDAGGDVCSLAADAMFRGRENQHYRVEVFRSGQAKPAETPTRSTRRTAAAAAEPARVVWSRDNGSDVYAITALAGAEVTVADLGRDRRRALDVGDLVEVVDDASAARVAQEEPTGPDRVLFTVIAVDDLRDVVTLDREPGVELGDVGRDPGRHPLLRRWDGAGAVDVAEGEWLDLEDGIRIRFPGSGTAKNPATYRNGDYWLVPARRSTGDVVWPQDDDGPAAVPPDGVTYAYAPLALVQVGGGSVVVDLRTTFSPLAV